MSTYYFDQTNGDDTNGDGSKGNPYKSIAKALSILGTGDMAIVRNNGGSETWASDQSPANDGSFYSPIVIRADDGTEWPADKSSLTNTYTTTNGSKAVTASASESELSAGDQVKLNGDERWYTVASVSQTTVTLEMTYRGPSGSGRSAEKLPPMPKIDGAASYYWDHDKSFWRMERLHIDDGGNVAEFAGAFQDAGYCNSLEGCRLVSAAGAAGLSPGRFGRYLRCQITSSGQYAAVFPYNTDGDNVLLDDCLIEGASLYGFRVYGYRRLVGELRNLECTNEAAVIKSEANSAELRLECYNVVFSASNFLGSGYRGSKTGLLAAVQDFNGTKRDNRVFTGLDPADDDAALRRNTSTTRSGGADSSIEVRPSTYLGTNAEWRRLTVLEAYLHLPASSKTVTVYLNLPVANFTSAPTAGELWVELEYLADSANAGRRVVRSTGAVPADGNWNDLSVGPVTPAAAGEAFLRVHYCKTKEDGKSNHLYVDPEPVIA